MRSDQPAIYFSLELPYRFIDARLSVDEDPLQTNEVEQPDIT